MRGLKYLLLSWLLLSPSLGQRPWNGAKNVEPTGAVEKPSEAVAVLNRSLDRHFSTGGEPQTVAITGSFCDLLNPDSQARPFMIAAAGVQQVRRELDLPDGLLVTVRNGFRSWRQKGREPRTNLPLSQHAGTRIEMLPVFALKDWIDSPDVKLEPGGRSTDARGTFDHVEIRRTPSGFIDRARLATEEANRLEVYIDTTSDEISRIRFFHHPFGEWRTDLPQDVLFSDYRMVGDVLWPFHVVVESNGKPTFDYQFESVQFDTAVDPDVFR